MSYYAQQQPKDGDIVLHCIHLRQSPNGHFFFFSKKMLFTRPDGTTGSAEWVSLCQECVDETGGQPTQLKVDEIFSRIAADSTWKGNEPAIKAEISHQN
jgi:hypothetical protein